MIRVIGNMFVVFTPDGTRVLGRYKTRAQAERVLMGVKMKAKQPKA